MAQVLAQATDSPSPPPAALLQVTGGDDQQRVRQFIQCRFAQEYAADIDVYSRHLIAMMDAERQIQAAVGYQSAAEGPLFLEQYLDGPVEASLMPHSRRPVSRNEIVEVGNLASRSGGWTRYLILNLAGFFARQEFNWLVITATEQVLNSFYKLGVGAALIPLTPADPALLKEDPKRWGSYYDNQPLVMAANIRLGRARLLRRRNPLPPGIDTPSDRQRPIRGLTP